jgi:phospholipid/cholesterol/gamma-HCH transport system substrate-binding protein
MPQRKQVSWSDLRVGLLVLVGLFLIAVTIFYVTGPGEFLAPKFQARTYLPEVSGLNIGAPVRLDGVEIGNVDAINMTRRPEAGAFDRNRSVEVVMRLNKAFQKEILVSRPFAEGNSTASLVTEGLLGNRYVNITRGVTGAQIQPGGEVPGAPEKAMKEIVERGAELVQNLNEVSKRVRTIIEAIDAGEGTIGKLIHDDRLYRNANSIVAKAERIVGTVESGEGTIGRLVKDDSLYQRAHSIAARTDGVLNDIQEQKGTLGKFIYDPKVYNDAKELVERGNRLATRIEKGEGTLGKLFTDETLYNNVRNAAANVEQATAKLNSDQGTAGRFFSDPQFYDNITGLAGDMRLLVGEFRQNPKKFLRVKFAIF